MRGVRREEEYLNWFHDFKSLNLIEINNKITNQDNSIYTIRLFGI